jgi:hypothetical protein
MLVWIMYLLYTKILDNLRTREPTLISLVKINCTCKFIGRLLRSSRLSGVWARILFISNEINSINFMVIFES